MSVIPSQQHHRGSALSEYGIILSVVAVVAIGGLVLLGSSLSGALGWLNNGFQGQMASAGNQQGADTGNGSNPAPPPTSPPPAALDRWQLTTGNGTALFLNYDGDLEKTVATAGANGTSEILANSIQALARQLLEKGEITPEQANTLLELANQGHRIAAVEKVLEQQARRLDSDPNALATEPLQFDGKTYTDPTDLAYLIGWNASKQQNGEEAIRFQNLLEQARREGSLNDPVIDKTITVLSEQILNLANGVESSFNEIAQGKVTTSFEKHMMARLDERVETGATDVPVNATIPVSKVTDQDASVICAAGDGTDGGTACKP